MEVLEPHKLIAGVPHFDIGMACREAVVCALNSLRMVRARVDAAEVALSLRLKTVSPLPEADVAGAARRPSTHGSKVRERAETASAIPALENAMERGELSGEHTDAFTKALKSAPPEIAAELKACGSSLVTNAIELMATPDEFARAIATEVVRLEGDDGEARLDRQRRSTRLRTWTDKQTGMWRLSGRFDPLSGLVLHGRLQAALSAMFAGATPANAPTDPGERQDYLRALALIRLTAGSTERVRTDSPPGPSTGKSDRAATASGSAVAGSAVAGSAVAGSAVARSGQDLDWSSLGDVGPPRFGRPEIVVIIDTTTLDSHGRPTIDWGLPIDLPFGALRSIGRRASVTRVVLNDGAVVEAPGELDLGRTTRLANRAQRRVLRCQYGTCAIPGCAVSFEYTKLHHVWWWRNGGRTDLANLLPLCSRHHDAAHTKGWKLDLGPKRELTVTLPNGKTMKTGPPKRTMVARR